MKLRSGFVSNSSSGSFIFPKGMSENEVEEIIRRIEVFLTEIKGKEVFSGLSEPYNDGWHVVANTLGDNSCPDAVYHILEDIVGAHYEHHG